eukprot:15530880-Heterocapsa_arctica.AAC.1
MKHTAIIMLVRGYTGPGTNIGRTIKYLTEQSGKGADAKMFGEACGKARAVSTCGWGLRKQNDQLCSRANSVWSKHQPLIVVQGPYIWWSQRRHAR